MLEALKNIPDCHTHIREACYSATAILAVAGNHRSIRRGAQILLHGPAEVVFGSAAHLRKHAEELDEVRQKIVAIFTETNRTARVSC
jgi:ATP-dependent protease ClpP protease subunit